MDLPYWGWEIVSILDHIWKYLHTNTETAIFYNSSNENRNTLTPSIPVWSNWKFLWHRRHILRSTWPSAALLLTCPPYIEIILCIYKRVLFSHFYPSLLQRSWPYKGCLFSSFVFHLSYSLSLSVSTALHPLSTLRRIRWPPSTVYHIPHAILSWTLKTKAACSSETLLST